jgi:transposase-like protein
MEQVPRQQYTKEFREQAVRLVLEQQVTIPEAATGLSSAGCVELRRVSSPHWERADGP